MNATEINYQGIKCDFCKTEIVKNVKSLEKLDYKGKIYIFEDVPIGVCNNCGEHYVHAKVIREMEKIVDNMERKELVPLYEFQEEFSY